MTSEVKPFVVLVPGIYTGLRGVDNWTGKAATWLFARHGIPSQIASYISGALTGPITQKKYGPRVAKMFEYLPDDQVIDCIGHSNGAGVLIRALEQSGRRIRNLFLFSPAVDRDIVPQVLVPDVESGQLEQVWILRAGRDTALWLADWTWFLLRGHDALGRHGVDGVSMSVIKPEIWTFLDSASNFCDGRIVDIVVPRFRHGTWFDVERGYFDSTMEFIVDAMKGDTKCLVGSKLLSVKS